MTEKIGQTKHEIDANLMLECRKIVKNLINFGVSDQQKIQIIYLLSLELESRDAMQRLIETVDKIKKMDNSVKFSLTTDEDEYNKNKSKLLDV